MKVMLGLSGGVDSSVAALRLIEAGSSVEGLFMQNWEEDTRNGPCRAEQDRKDAVAVCAALGLPFHHRNFASEYWDGVFEHFLAEYRAGRTPNPDVLCNREIKFRTFLEHARALGAEKIATGHYARIDRHQGSWRLLRALDRAKDQTYFLHALGQQQLAATLFPIGDMQKHEVRRTARDAGLPTHDKKDSTGICFIGERNFRSFLGQYLPARPGLMKAPDGTVLGEHDGVMFYTLGQRSGLNIGGRREHTGEPWYVVGKDVAANVLFVAQGGANRWLMSRRLEASAPTWVAGDPPSGVFSCTAKVRYRQDDQSCRVRVVNDRLHVEFEQPQRAVTPGQSIVFYAGEECLGGGIIEASDAPCGGLATANHPPLTDSALQ